MQISTFWSEALCSEWRGRKAVFLLKLARVEMSWRISLQALWMRIWSPFAVSHNFGV
jgi:hypothetical protein